jgi:hypothetical protein
MVIMFAPVFMLDSTHQEMDEDNDGVISFQEYVNVMDKVAISASPTPN